MLVENNSLLIYAEGQLFPESGSSGYVYLKHDTCYSICMTSMEDARKDAQVYVDGKYVGTWRLEPFRDVKIERPVHAPNKFTFYAAGSQEFVSSDLNSVDKQNLGLIQVVFIPEKKVDYSELDQVFSLGALKNIGATRGGGTGLSTPSSQTFGTASEMITDSSKAVAISLRLREAKDGPKPLHDLRQVGMIKGNPVPPA
jgi:hypothetical protein